MNIIKYMNQHTDEYFSKVLRRAKKTNHAYRQADQQLIDCSKAFDVRDSAFNDYSNAMYAVSDIERELIYAQGHKDCLALLRFLRLL